MPQSQRRETVSLSMVGSREDELVNDGIAHWLQSRGHATGSISMV